MPIWKPANAKNVGFHYNEYRMTGGSKWAERIQSTARIRFRFWKDWKLFVKDLVCILEVHRAGACIILYMRSWIMR